MSALLKRSQRQADLEKNITQTRRKLKVTKRQCGMQEESAEEQVVTMYHLLQPEEGKQGPRNLEARDKVAIRIRDMWSAVSLFKGMVHMIDM